MSGREHALLGGAQLSWGLLWGSENYIFSRPGLWVLWSHNSFKILSSFLDNLLPVKSTTCKDRRRSCLYECLVYKHSFFSHLYTWTIFSLLNSSNFEAIWNNRLERDNNPLNSIFAVGLAPGSISRGPWRKALKRSILLFTVLMQFNFPAPRGLHTWSAVTSDCNATPRGHPYPSCISFHPYWQPGEFWPNFTASLHRPLLKAAGSSQQKAAFWSRVTIAPTAPGLASVPLAFKVISGTSFTSVWLWFDKGHQLFSLQYRFPCCLSHNY